MSRKINPNKPLSDADREYLKLWSREGDIFQHEVNLAAREAEAADGDDSEEEGFDEDLIQQVEAMTLEDIKAELKKRNLKYGGDDQLELANRLLNNMQDARDAEKS